MLETHRDRNRERLTDTQIEGQKETEMLKRQSVIKRDRKTEDRETETEKPREREQASERPREIKRPRESDRERERVCDSADMEQACRRSNTSTSPRNTSTSPEDMSPPSPRSRTASPVKTLLHHHHQLQSSEHKSSPTHSPSRTLPPRPPSRIAPLRSPSHRASTPGALGTRVGIPPRVHDVGTRVGGTPPSAHEVAETQLLAARGDEGTGSSASAPEGGLESPTAREAWVGGGKGGVGGGGRGKSGGGRRLHSDSKISSQGSLAIGRDGGRHSKRATGYAVSTSTLAPAVPGGRSRAPVVG